MTQVDEDGSGEIEFGEFCQLCATFLVEDPDMETMQKELRDSFRLYDKEGQGFITMETLRGLICMLNIRPIPQAMPRSSILFPIQLSCWGPCLMKTSMAL